MEDNKYSRGKIYTIRCRTDDSLVYVGSTINELRKRWNSHKTLSRKNTKQRNLFDVIEENGGFNNWYMEILEKYPCKDCSELHKREGELIRQYGTLNKVINGRTKAEYAVDNREKLKELKREWDLNNKERKAYHDKKYKNGIHREEILERKREYHQNNKEEINKKRRERKIQQKLNETPYEKELRLKKQALQARELRRLKKEQQQKTE